MSSATVGSGLAPARAVIAGLVLAVAFACFYPAASLACWGEHPDAEEAFREGFTLFEEGSYEKAIERLRVAKEKRRDADPNCTVQLSARNPGDKAYYLPRFYLGVASYRLYMERGDESMACEEAMMFFSGAERKLPGETRTIYEKFRKRFRDQARELAEIKASCQGVDGLGGASLAVGRQSTEVGSGVD
jgi:hypothetical protein